MNADVYEVMDRTSGNQWLDYARIHALRESDGNVRKRRAAHRERHRMLGRVARLEMHHIIVFIVMHCGLMMLVCGRSVMVLRMIVIHVRVDVQARNLT